MPGGNKPGGGLQVGSAYKMKNSALHMGAKHGAPIQKNYGAPTKKTLVGNQHNLPEDLKAKIEAAPGKMKAQDTELKPPTPAFNRAADPLAKGTETTRTSKNLVTGGTNTVAKYGSPNKLAGLAGMAVTGAAMSKIGKKMSEDKENSPTDYGKHAK